MLLITKGQAPQQLLDAKRRLDATPDAIANYDALDSSEKRSVLDALLREQGYVCAYCTRRIHRKGDAREKGDFAHVEHYLPRHPTDALRKSLASNNDYDENELSLDFANMLAVCSGGEAEGAKRAQICDKSRSDTSMLTVNPLDAKSISRIAYKSSGNIYSDDTDIERDLNEQLNLNAEEFSFPENRKQAMRSVDTWAHALQGGHQTKRNACNKKRNSLLAHMGNSDVEPFLGVILWRLDYWIRRWA